MGHHDNVTRLTWSEDGKRLCSASDDGTVKLYELGFYNRDYQNGSDDATLGCSVKLLATFMTHNDRIKGCFIMRDDLIYVLTRDAKITAWKWTSFNEEGEEIENEDVEMNELENGGEESDGDDESGMKKKVKKEEGDRNEEFIKVKKGIDVGDDDEEEEDDGEEIEEEEEDDVEEEEDEEIDFDKDEEEEEDGDIKMEKPERKWITRFNNKFYRKRRTGRWSIGAKYNIGASINQKVKSCTFHRQSNLLVVGFTVNIHFISYPHLFQFIFNILIIQNYNSNSYSIQFLFNPIFNSKF